MNNSSYLFLNILVPNNSVPVDMYKQRPTFLPITKQQQYQSFRVWVVIVVTFGLWDERTGFGVGMDFICSIVIDVVRCGRFGGLVKIVLLELIQPYTLVGPPVKRPVLAP